MIGSLPSAGLALFDESQLRRVLNAIPHLVWTATREGVCDFLGERWVQYTGIAEREQLGANWVEQVHPDDRYRIMVAWRETLTNGSDLKIDFRIRRSDGQYRWFDTRATPIRDPDGNIVKWLGTNTDVHETYAAREALAENEERLRYVELATHDCVYDWDVRIGKAYRNEQFRRTFGVGTALQSERDWFEESIHPDDRRRVLEGSLAAIAGRRTQWGADYRLRRLDGTYAEVTDRAYLLYDADGNLQRIIGAIADLSEHRQFERTLRDSQARLKSALQAGGFATFVWDIAAEEIVWDEYTCVLWGRRADEIRKMSYAQVIEMVLPEDRSVIAAAEKEFRRHGTTLMSEFRTIRPDGRLQWLTVTGQLERDADGRPIRLIGIYLDVTARKLVEQELRDSQARLRAAMRAAGLATWSWEVRDDVVTWDESAYQLWGRNKQAEDPLSMAKVTTFTHPDSHAVEVLDNFYATGMDITHEIRTLRPDGALQWLVAQGMIERDDSGQPVRAVGVYIDITERKRIEQSLRDSQDRLRSAMDAAGLATWIWDLEADELIWDDATYRLWGRAPEAGPRLGVRQVEAWVHPDDRAALRPDVPRLREQGLDQPIEFRTVRPDGALQWLLAKGQIQTDAGGKAYRMSGVFVDITDRKHSEEAQLRSQKMEALGTLAGGIAHDFNNILLAISGNAALATEDLRAALSQEHSVLNNLREIERAARRAAELVRRILAFSRQQETQQEILRLPPIIEDALRLLRPTLPASVEIHAALDVNASPVASEAIQIQQVVMNLVTNAAHAIGDRSGEITVSLRDSELSAVTTLDAGELAAGRYVCLSVEDSGTGIGQETVKRMFDPFFTTKQAGQGTGLGLAVVHGIVQSHGGAIGVESELGGGTTFRVYLPAAVGEVVAKEASPPAPPVPARGERVLYVDDEEALVFLVSRVLERLGYRVTGYLDPLLALSELRNRPADFDVVVTDLSMRGMNGFELARELRKLRADLPVLLTSGYLRSEDRATAADIGIRELILKPNTVEELGRAIDRVLVEIRGRNTHSTR